MRRDVAPGERAHRFVGCGVVAVFDYSGYAWVFEQPSESGGSAAPAPRLVGAAKFGDACSSAACSTSSWTAGFNFVECDYGPAFDCQVCGDDPNTDFPPCSSDGIAGLAAVTP